MWPDSSRVAVGARSGFDLWPVFVARILEWLRAEAGPGRLLPWIPVAFGSGIALYFAADREPVAMVVVPVAAMACAAAFSLRRSRSFAIALLIAALLAGFATATLRTVYVSHPVLLYRSIGMLKGFVETHEERERTDRFVLRVVSSEGSRGVSELKRVRLSVRKGTAPAVGSFVELKARLQPPLRPLRPGSYDFGRDMYFQGIGASGFVLGAIKTRPPPQGGGWLLRYSALMQDMRDAVDARIRTVLSGDGRSIATALLTGRRDAITTPVNDAMFISGLGHVLSISGYHMAVVAGVVFFAVRALLALSPALAARYAIKKWAAGAALAAALFYLLLSGAEVATQRSFYMTAFVLIAVMVDRRAITFRTLALAAMLVLMIAPEAVVHPSFQMSFAATLGLVALAQIGMPQLFSGSDKSVNRIAAWGGRELMLLTVASLVAGLATTPYAAFHFHRITPYGVLANLAAMPVVSALVMPAGIMGVLAIPFGLDAIFWELMGIGIDWMITVTQWVAALPGAIGRVTAFGVGPLIMTTIGIVLLGLLRTPLRWSGAGIIAVGVVWAGLTPQPDILISADGSSVGVRTKTGQLRVMRISADAFLLREWLAGDADGRAVTDTSVTEGVSCDEAGCVVQDSGGHFVALARTPEALADDCTQAAVVVTAHQSPADCAALVIDRETLKRRGAMTLIRTQDGYSIAANQPRGVDRPWSPAMRDDQDSDGGETLRTKRTPPKPPVDVTPSDVDLQAED
ncbi:MAG: ComEC family competence protein [Xanthobacteraceae bacterium]|nr:ComEC family competence protein [Xanthobacteraceae bacterium]